ncbi:MAG: hypothetical protein RMK29_07615 [Myxococcales bacterium]|nr:hypothetical protein [Myxococcota bacterium]MDW8281562.1 hypothetical protein [Myxococcales bacterium]
MDISLVDPVRPCLVNAVPPATAREVAAAAEELRGRGALLRAATLCQHAAEQRGGSLYFTAGKALCHAGLLPEAEAALRRYLREAADRPPAPGDDPEASAEAARHLLGRVAMLDGQLRLAERWLRAALAGAEGEARVPLLCDLARVWLRDGRVDRAVAVLGMLCRHGGREICLLGAEVAMMLGLPDRAATLCRAALDPQGRDDRAAALLATLLLRQDPANPAPALALLPLLPGRRFDTLAVRLCLLRLGGQVPEPAENVGAAAAAAAELLEALRTEPLPIPLL